MSSLAISVSYRNIERALSPYSDKAGPEEPTSGEARTPPPPPWLLQGLVKPGPGGVSRSPAGDIHTSRGNTGNCDVEMVG